MIWSSLQFKCFFLRCMALHVDGRVIIHSTVTRCCAKKGIVSHACVKPSAAGPLVQTATVGCKSERVIVSVLLHFFGFRP